VVRTAVLKSLATVFVTKSAIQLGVTLIMATVENARLDAWKRTLGTQCARLTAITQTACTTKETAHCLARCV